MHPFEVLAEPIRRRIFEVLASGEHTSGMLEQVVMQEFGVGRSGAQHHLSYLRRVDWVIVEHDETTRWYRLQPEVIEELEREVKRFRRLWNRRIGWRDRTDPLAPNRFARLQKQPVSRKGRRSHGVDPDDPWLAR